MKKFIKSLLVFIGVRKLWRYYLKKKTIKNNKKNLIYTRRMTAIDRERDDYIYDIPINDMGGDYIRLSSLELIADQIDKRQLHGSVAELGVYKGEFAEKINRAFPERKLYLFDTFEGFDNRDIKTEVKNNYSSSELQKEAFLDTNIELVLNRMKYRENCIIKKGFFPETASGIDEKFVFVSIDADLFEPIYVGLQFFYPLLQKGGFIFVHDYNNKYFSGAKEAVNKYADENNISFFPLSDEAGSAVFLK